VPSTPKYSLPYPALADSPNGAAQIQSLATATETAIGGLDTKMGSRPTCLVTRNTNQTIANTADTDVSWTTVVQNDSVGGLAMFDLSVPARITIREDGWYVFGCLLGYVNNSTGFRTAVIGKNNTGTPTNANTLGFDADGGIAPPGPAGGTPLKITGEDRFVSGDILRVSTYQSSGAALDLLAGTLHGRLRFWARKVRD
jgi:hypothetical protein